MLGNSTESVVAGMETPQLKSPGRDSSCILEGQSVICSEHFTGSETHRQPVLPTVFLPGKRTRLTIPGNTMMKRGRTFRYAAIREPPLAWDRFLAARVR